MKLQFDPSQQHQLDAVNAVADLFRGQPADGCGPAGAQGEGLGAVFGNRLSLGEEGVIMNLHEVQKRNGLDLSVTEGTAPVYGMRLPAVLPAALGAAPMGSAAMGGSRTPSLKEGMNFSVEMETGTGKTYVYLRTVHELAKRYGWRKFVIVVPSVAIREGALKNLQVTAQHFEGLYGASEVDFTVWDSRKRGQARAFATADAIQVMVINIDSFSKQGDGVGKKGKGVKNVIYRAGDDIPAMDYLSAARPVVIVDEPQNMETDNRKEAIANLKPLFVLRYSATHKNPYNLVYRLDPVRAYDLGLVKKIEVDSVMEESAFNAPYVLLKSVEAKGRKVAAKMVLDVETKSGVARKAVSVASGDDLAEVTGRPQYRGYVVDALDVSDVSATFANGVSVTAGQVLGGAGDELPKYMVQKAVRNHLDKEKKLSGTGIKPLTLFFLDKVANYRQYGEAGPVSGKFAKWFEEEYEKARQESKYAGLRLWTAKEVHDGYFSKDRKGVLKDTDGETKDDDRTYELIMRDKERLLSPNEPLRFIFSHSALREGWDNPNVFQICTLNETRSDMKKRQEIGRGMRLPVGADGKQVRDADINVLTVVANESYEDFAKSLQAEMAEDCGVDFGGRIKNKKARVTVRARKGFALNADFKAIWDRIKHKTRYRVEFSTDELVRAASERLKAVTVPEPRITDVTARLGMGKDGVSAQVVRGGAAKALGGSVRTVPDLLAMVESHTKLTRATILRIFRESGKLADALKNPQAFADLAAHEIASALRALQVGGIKYERVTGAEWEMARFESEELQAYLDGVVRLEKGEKTAQEAVFADGTAPCVLKDSDVETEFAKALEAREEVRFYFKLPAWFKIDTPLGDYNPDWAVVLGDDKKVYFVAETKGTDDLEKITPDEKAKILCGKAHFKELDGVGFYGPVKDLEGAIGRWAA